MNSSTLSLGLIRYQSCHAKRNTWIGLIYGWYWRRCLKITSDGTLNGKYLLCYEIHISRLSLSQVAVNALSEFDVLGPLGKNKLQAVINRRAYLLGRRFWTQNMLDIYIFELSHCKQMEQTPRKNWRYKASASSEETRRTTTGPTKFARNG